MRISCPSRSKSRSRRGRRSSPLPNPKERNVIARESDSAMNAHEAERIAAAIHQLRPDWPTRQLLTLMDHKQLRERPRRDVLVALAWVASESGSASPYRVLESGPWWRAVAVDDGQRRLERGPWCTVCGDPIARHRYVDHEPTTVRYPKRSREELERFREVARSVGRLE